MENNIPTINEALLESLREEKNRLIRFMAHLDRSNDEAYKSYEALKDELGDDQFDEVRRIIASISMTAFELGMQMSELKPAPNTLNNH